MVWEPLPGAPQRPPARDPVRARLAAAGVRLRLGAQADRCGVAVTVKPGAPFGGGRSRGGALTHRAGREPRGGARDAGLAGPPGAADGERGPFPPALRSGRWPDGAVAPPRAGLDSRSAEP